jgi:hypothetical protein
MVILVSVGCARAFSSLLVAAAFAPPVHRMCPTAGLECDCAIVCRQRNCVPPPGQLPIAQRMQAAQRRFGLARCVLSPFTVMLGASALAALISNLALDSTCCGSVDPCTSQNARSPCVGVKCRATIVRLERRQ